MFSRYSHRFLFFAVFLFLFLIGPELFAQCPMCRASAETNLQEGGTEAKGLNAGILYLLSAPYVLVGLLGYYWWNNRRNAQIQEDRDEIRGILDGISMK